MKRQIPGRPVRIAYVIPSIESGGTERHLLDLVRLLDPSRHRAVVLTTAGGGSLWEEFRDVVPVKVHGDPRRTLAKRSSLPRQFRTLLFLMRELRRERPDIVHAYLPAANALGPVAARLTGVPRIIVSKRSLGNYKRNYPVAHRLEHLGNRLADIVLVNSDAVARDVAKSEPHWQGKIRKVYNGVAEMPPWSEAEINAFREREALPPQAPVVLAVSNFFAYKGHDDLVRAFAEVLAKVPDAILLLAGRDGGNLREVRELAAQLKVEGSVRFLGSRDDVPDLLRGADLFAHPSREEGFSNAVLEAMAAGLPVLACRAGGNEEAVVDGETGRLVPPADPPALAAAMSELLLRGETRRAMGEAGRRRASDRFSRRFMADGMEAIYRELMEEGVS